MNIDDITNVKLPKIGFFPAIFAHQAALMERYHEIEQRNGANSPAPPFVLDDKHVQWRIKDLFWRATEELAEAIECMDHVILQVLRPMEAWDSDPQLRHFYEEMIDALHFIVEAMITSGIVLENDQAWTKYLSERSRNVLVSDIFQFRGQTQLRIQILEIITSLGLAANCLKNKPWKQTHMPTDVNRYKTFLMDTWKLFLLLWSSLGVGLKELYIIYAKKAEVNRFRQRSQY
jgi:hypothetical protein